MSSFMDVIPLAEAPKVAIDNARAQIKTLFGSNLAMRSAFLRLAFYDAILHNSIRLSYTDDRLPGPIKLAIAQLEKLRAEDVNIGLNVSYADLYQLAGVEAIKSISGIDVQFDLGRRDSLNKISLGQLQDFTRAEEGDDAVLVRNIFQPRGFTDKEIVALFSAIIFAIDPSIINVPANTAGPIDLYKIYDELDKRFKGRVASTAITTLSNDPTKVASTENPTSQSSTKVNQSDISKTQSSTKVNQSDISKTQSVEKIASNVAKSFSHWKCLLSDPTFYRHVQDFATNEDTFVANYKSAHKKLLELGFHQHFPELEYHEARHSIAFAVAMAILIGVVGFFYETMRT